MIRAAKMADTIGIVALFREAYARSPYRDHGVLDEAYARREIIQKSIMYHGHKNAVGTNVIVAERDGLIVGIHIGVKQRLGVVGTALFATDLLFLVGKDATPFMAPAMIRNFEDWAALDPRIVTIKPGVNSDVDDWHAGQSFYERMGYEQDGAIMRKSVIRERKAA